MYEYNLDIDLTISTIGKYFVSSFMFPAVILFISSEKYEF